MVFRCGLEANGSRCCVKDCASLPRMMGMTSAEAPLLEDLDLRFHHVGVAVRSIEDSLGFFLDVLGCRLDGGPVEVPPQHVRVCFLHLEPGVRIELVEGLDQYSPVEKLLDRLGAGTYHICYEVRDLAEAVRRLKTRKCRLIQSFEMPDLRLRHFAFLLSPERRLFELCQSEGVDDDGKT